jgi:hypothetical protein
VLLLCLVLYALWFLLPGSKIDWYDIWKLDVADVTKSPIPVPSYQGNQSKVPFLTFPYAQPFTQTPACVP